MSNNNNYCCESVNGSLYKSRSCYEKVGYKNRAIDWEIDGCVVGYIP